MTIINSVDAYRLQKGALGNSVNPDQTPQSAVSDQGLHCFTVCGVLIYSHKTN